MTIMNWSICVFVKKAPSNTLTKRSRDNFVPVRIVECNCIHDISVPFQSQQFVASYCVPNFTGSIVTSGDKFISRFVECTIRQGKNVSPQDFEKEKIAAFIAFQLLHQFCRNRWWKRRQNQAYERTYYKEVVEGVAFCFRKWAALQIQFDWQSHQYQHWKRIVI